MVRPKIREEKGRKKKKKKKHDQKKIEKMIMKDGKKS